MTTNNLNEEEKDKALWRIAKKRAAFKKHLSTYLIVNAFLWAIWYFTGQRINEGSIPWPAWASLGWGVGLAFNYAAAYHNIDIDNTEKEYQKLKNKQS